MRWLLFFSRVAFICNLFFVVAFTLQMSNWIKNHDLAELVIIIGYALAFLCNPFVNLSYLFVRIFRKTGLKPIPQWLITSNILFLLIQLLYFFYLNDTQHPQG
jgi:hypothetical protein